MALQVDHLVACLDSVFLEIDESILNTFWVIILDKYFCRAILLMKGKVFFKVFFSFKQDSFSNQCFEFGYREIQTS